MAILTISIVQTDGGKDLENTGGGKRRNSLPNKREARRTETRTDDQIPGRDGRRGHNGASFLEDLEANAIQRQWLGRERRSAAARKDHHACSIRYRSPEDTMAIREARSARHERRFETTVRFIMICGITCLTVHTHPCREPSEEIQAVADVTGEVPARPSALIEQSLFTRLISCVPSSYLQDRYVYRMTLCHCTRGSAL